LVLISTSPTSTLRSQMKLKKSSARIAYSRLPVETIVS